MRKGKIWRQFENFKTYKDLNGKPLKHDWVARVVILIQIHLIFSGRYNPYFWDIRLKIYRLPNNIVFQLMLTKFFKGKLFLCWPKVNHMTN